MGGDGNVFEQAGRLLDPQGPLGMGTLYQAPTIDPVNASDAELLLSQIAAQMFNQTQPSRDSWNEIFAQVQGGGYDPTTNAAYAPAREALEAQYGGARENVLASMPSGGALDSALANVETGRAREVGGLSSQIIMDLLNKSFGSAFGAPGEAMGGASSAASLANQRTLAAQQATTAADKGLGSWGPGGFK